MHSNHDTKAPSFEFPMRFDPASIEKPHLVTFVFSHYCELARWALVDASVDFVEVPYALGCHTGPLAKLRANRAHRSESAYAGMESGVHAGRRKYAVPLLLMPDGRVLRDSWEILEAYVGTVDEQWRTRLDHAFAPAIRQIFYTAVLNPESSSLLASLTQHATPLEQRVWTRLGPTIMDSVRLTLNVNDASDRAGRRLVESTFADAETYLASCGANPEKDPSMRAWWMAFCSFSSIAVLAPEYCHGMWQPPALEVLPADLADWITQMRETSVGRRVRAFYATQRKGQNP